MRSVRILFGASAALLSVSLVLLVRELVLGNANPSSVAIAGAALLAASAGWLFNNAVSILVKIREQSLNYLKHATEGLVLPELAASLTADWNKQGLGDIIKSEGSVNDFCKTNYPALPLFKTLRTMANQYEQMAVAIKCDAVEERMLRLYFATSLDWFFSRLKPFLPWFRNYPRIEGHPFGDKSIRDAFSHCEWLANRWGGDEGH